VRIRIFAAFSVFGLLCAGQQLDLSSLDKLAAKAKSSRVITLDPDKLALASSLLNEKDGKDLVGKLKGLSVRSFEFAAKGAYSKSDLDAIRKQLTGPGWSKVISVKEEDEDVEIWFYKSGDAGGMAVVAAEPTELTVVHLAGPADLSALSKLSGLAGGTVVESIVKGANGAKQAPSGPTTTPKPAAKEDEDEN
jgi:hypothetical protein